MNITQRKLIHGYNRATMSDHQRRMHDSLIVNDIYVVGLMALFALAAILNVCGVL